MSSAGRHMDRRQFVIVCLLIVGSIVLTRTVVAEFTHWAMLEGNFQNAFFIVWTNTSVIIIVIPFFSLSWHVYQCCRSDGGGQHVPLPASDDAGKGSEPAAVPGWLRILCFNFPFEKYPKPTIKQLCTLVVPMAALWVGSSYVYYSCFSMTAPGNIQAIYQAITVFVFGYEWVLLGAKPTTLKARIEPILPDSLVGWQVASIFVNAGGVVLCTYAKHQSDPHDEDYTASPWFADGAILFAAATWGLYQVLLKKAFGQLSLPVLFLWLELIGLVNVLLFWPVFFILDRTGVEPFQFPQGQVAIVIFSIAFLALTTSVLVNVGLALITPYFVASAMLLAIPATAAADYLLGHGDLQPFYIVGATLIFAGFVCNQYDVYRKKKLDDMRAAAAKYTVNILPEDRTMSSDSAAGVVFPRVESNVDYDSVKSNSTLAAQTAAANGDGAKQRLLPSNSDL